MDEFDQNNQFQLLHAFHVFAKSGRRLYVHDACSHVVDGRKVVATALRALCTRQEKICFRCFGFIIRADFSLNYAQRILCSLTEFYASNFEAKPWKLLNTLRVSNLKGNCARVRGLLLSLRWKCSLQPIAVSLLLSTLTDGQLCHYSCSCCRYYAEKYLRLQQQLHIMH